MPGGHSSNLVPEWLFTLPPAQFSLLASLIGILLIDGLTPAQQNALGNFLITIGQSLATSSAQAAVLKEQAQTVQSLVEKLQEMRDKGAEPGTDPGKG